VPQRSTVAEVRNLSILLAVCVDIQNKKAEHLAVIPPQTASLCKFLRHNLSLRNVQNCRKSSNLWAGNGKTAALWFPADDAQNSYVCARYAKELELR
jgi:hypothetical protein